MVGLNVEKKDWMRELFKNHAQVLIATEAGGEGINLQFCHHIINYDLPWNPMRIEQRIGRLHRLGQEHDVQIYNFAVQETIEQKKYWNSFMKRFICLSLLLANWMISLQKWSYPILKNM